VTHYTVSKETQDRHAGGEKILSRILQRRLPERSKGATKGCRGKRINSKTDGQHSGKKHLLGRMLTYPVVVELGGGGDYWPQD